MPLDKVDLIRFIVSCLWLIGLREDTDDKIDCFHESVLWWVMFLGRNPYERYERVMDSVTVITQDLYTFHNKSNVIYCRTFSNNSYNSTGIHLSYMAIINILLCEKSSELTVNDTLHYFSETIWCLTVLTSVLQNATESRKPGVPRLTCLRSLVWTKEFAVHVCLFAGIFFVAYCDLFCDTLIVSRRVLPEAMDIINKMEWRCFSPYDDVIK